MMAQLVADVPRAEQVAARRPAIVCGAVRLTYAAFAARCRALAGGLRRRGVGREDRVAVIMANCHRYLEAYLAVPGIAGPTITPGYWKRPRETTETLRTGRLHTGDLGYLDEDGYLYLVDRAKDVIISAGENVHSTEVEDAVRAHPAVSDAAAIGLPDAVWGERVHAVVVLRDGHRLTAEELRDCCRKRLAGYKCPRTLDVVDALPRSGSGVVLKRQLRAERTHAG